VLRQQCQIDEHAFLRAPGHPDFADRQAVELDQFVVGAREASLPVALAREELQVEEPLPLRVVPAVEIGPRARVQRTEKRRIGCDRRTPAGD
jgi:hypothetical protein